jgi:hypothetical protein
MHTSSKTCASLHAKVKNGEGPKIQNFHHFVVFHLDRAHTKQYIDRRIRHKHVKFTVHIYMGRLRCVAYYIYSLLSLYTSTTLNLWFKGIYLELRGNLCSCGNFLYFLVYFLIFLLLLLLGIFLNLYM